MFPNSHKYVEYFFESRVHVAEMGNKFVKFF